MVLYPLQRTVTSRALNTQVEVREYDFWAHMLTIQAMSEHFPGPQFPLHERTLDSKVNYNPNSITLGFWKCAPNSR